MLDPEIVLQKDPETDPTAARIKKHSFRPPDVGIGILITIPCYRAGREVHYGSVAILAQAFFGAGRLFFFPCNGQEKCRSNGS